MTTWQTFLFAISLGLGAGITPGPLSSLVIQESLRGGWKSGACVALAPPVADILVVGLVLAVLHQLPPASFSVLSLIGGCLCASSDGRPCDIGPHRGRRREARAMAWGFRKGLLVQTC